MKTKKKTSKVPAKKPAVKLGKASAKPAVKKKVSKPAVKAADETQIVWNLRLYVAGQTPRALTAFANLKRMCEDYLPGRYEIEVVDLIRQPERAGNDQIVALPTLVRRLPEPIKRIVGDLSDTERVVVGMELKLLNSLQPRT